MAAHDDAVPLILDELQKQIHQLTAHHGVKPGCGLVQHQQLGVMGQCGGQAQFQPHTAAVLLEFFAGVQLEAPQIRGKGLIAPPRSIHARHAAANLCGGEAPVEKGILKHNANLSASGGIGRGAAQQVNRAVIRPVDAAEDFQKRRLACAVLADQPDDAACGHGHINRPKGKVFVLLRDAA